MCDGSGPKRPLPFAADTQDGALGEASFHSHPAPTAIHETTAVQVWHIKVSPQYRAKLCFTIFAIKVKLIRTLLVLIWISERTLPSPASGRLVNPTADQ